MDINKRIENINPYFKEMQILNEKGKNIIYIKTLLPKSWTTPDDLLEKYDVDALDHTMINETPGTFVFFTDISNGYEKIFDSIEYSITKNKEAEERVKLYKEKAHELQQIFLDEKNPIKTLRTLTFTFNKQNKSKNKTNKNDKVSTDLLNEIPCEYPLNADTNEKEERFYENIESKRID